MGRAERLEHLVDKGLDVLEEVMDIPLDRSDEHFPRVLSAKKDAALGVVNLQLKADENTFRARSQDGLMKLLETVLAKEVEVGVLIEGSRE